MDVAEPLSVPASPQAPARAPLPLVAALVPVIAGLTLWAVTGSLLSLAFAGLGPLMMFGSLIDGARQRRGVHRAAVREAEQQWEGAEAALVQAQAALRARARREHPRLRDQAAGAALAGDEVSAQTALVVGVGQRPSGLRVTGGDGVRAEDFRARAATVGGMPVTVALGRGIALRGPAALTAAVTRGLLASLALRCSPAQLGVTGEGVAVVGADRLPHAQGVRAALRVEVAIGVPSGEADAALCLIGPGEDTPPGVSAVIDCADPHRARVRTAQESQTVTLDALSADQLAALAAHWPGWAAGSEVPETLALAELEPAGEHAGLAATIGRDAAGSAVVDLHSEGPHAIVTGMTGAGKSELLITWVLALAARHAPTEVAFVLADFKGGTAFEALRPLPHVAAIITDLDEEGARRGVQSLRAELRRRERELARVGAREIGGTGLPRLVIVVDEFAALLGEHPDLAEVFTDIAARGRALGMHLILGTQRAAGVIRDSLAANCPLRMSLRLTDPADSRAVIGSAEAAELPGDARGRGLAMIRRPADEHARRTRLALSAPADIAAVAQRWAGQARARSPWLPALPLVLTPGEVPVPAGQILLGLGDEPAQQRQAPVTLTPGADRGMLIVGGPGSGKSTVLALAASHGVPCQWIGPDTEAAWDLVSAEDALPPLLLGDDLDAVLSQFPPDYAAAFVERLERLLRRAAASGSGVLLTVSRMTGALARLGDLLPRRALLALPSRTEHLAAGGNADSFRPGRPPGRAVIDGMEVQFATALPPVARAEHCTPRWEPAAGITALVTAQPEAWFARLAATYPGVRIQEPGPMTEPETDSRAAAGERPTLVVADGETWQRHWALWQRLRGEALVTAESAVELRTLAGLRELPPYARTHAGRAWLLRGGGRPVRVLLGDAEGES